MPALNGVACFLLARSIIFLIILILIDTKQWRQCAGGWTSGASVAAEVSL